MDRLAAMAAFVRVVDAGSFSGAAKQLRIGQPAVSKTIAQLEDRLGARLQEAIVLHAGVHAYSRDDWIKVLPLDWLWA